jgi:uncharacterized repeat protein (TIGR03803 family)
MLFSALSRRHSHFNGKRYSRQVGRKRNMQVVMEAAESRVLLSTSYTLNPVYTFDGGNNGGKPDYGMILVDGNLYGTTDIANTTGSTVFEIPAGSTTPTTLQTFTDDISMSPLVYDGNGHIFGTSEEGGPQQDGSIYEIDVTGSSPVVTEIATFDTSAEGGIEGNSPQGALAVDGSGNLYGVTYSGGANSNGTVYEVADPTGGSPTIQTLASFDPTTNGADPNTGVILYNGALYGTTAYTPNNLGTGEIFKYDIGTQDLTAQVIWNSSDTDLDGSLNPLTVDSSGDLFTSSTSGAQSGEDGSIFEVTPGSTTYETLTTLSGSDNGPSGPIGALTIGSDGNFYGATTGGGTNNAGTIFEMDASTHVVTPLASLDSSTTGDNPNGGLTFIGNNIYGTASSGGTDGDGAIFEVTAAGPPTKLVFVQQPISSQTAGSTITSASGSAQPITVDIEDANGNLIANDTSTVTLSVASPSGATFATGSTASVAAVGGVATFSNLTLDTAGTYTLTASDTDGTTALTAPTNATQFTITYATAAKLAFVTQPTTNVAVGANFGPVVVDIEDQYGNLVTNNASAVTLGINTGGVTGETITGTTTAAAVAGVATFNSISMPDNGTYTLAGTDSSLTGAVSSSFIVGTGVNQAGAASQVVITNTPTVTPGSPTTVDAALEDQNGNIETSDNSSTITLTINGPNGATTVPLTVTNGAAAFNLSLTDPGNYSFGASSGSFTSSTTSTSTLSYTAPQAVITQPIGVVIAGQKIHPITLTLYNANQIVTDAKSKVTLTVLTPSGAKAYGPVKVTTKTGSATFKNIYFKLAANGYQLEATTPGYAPAYSTLFDVIPAAAKKLTFTEEPTPNPVAHGSAFNTDLKVVDAYGNAISGSAVTISLSGNAASALSGVLSESTVDGSADFDGLTLSAAGNYTIAAADGKLKAKSKKLVVT